MSDSPRSTGSIARRTARAAAPLIVIWLMNGCVSMAPDEPAATIGPDRLLSGDALGVSGGGRLMADADVLRLSPEMTAFIDQYVDRNANAYLQLHQLIYAVIGDATFGLTYDNQTQTAEETFRDRSGNCLSFTNLFVSMARDVGLRVSYQEVDIPPDWTESDGTFTLNRHVNVHVDLGMAGGHVVDFNIGDFRSSYDRRIISDQRALAHFFNNKGVQALQRGNAGAAFANLRHALARDPEFAPAWSNLGTLYRRQRLWTYAEASYLQALEVNRNEYVAMSNLASLYAERGDAERSAWFEKRASRHRMRNPYYRFGLARDAFRDGDFDSAIGHLRYAVRRKPQEDSFHFLLGLSYLQKGDAKRARPWLDRAEALAQTDALKRNYRSKIDLLLSSGEE